MNYSQLFPYIQEASQGAPTQRLIFTKEASEKLILHLSKNIPNFDENKINRLSDDETYQILGEIRDDHIMSAYLFSDFYLVDWLDNLKIVKIYADYDAILNIEFDV